MSTQLHLDQQLQCLKIIEAMKPKSAARIHPRELLDRRLRAQQYWRWAFELLKKGDHKERLHFGKVTKIGGDDLEEESDSDPDLLSDTKSAHVFTKEQFEAKKKKKVKREQEVQKLQNPNYIRQLSQFRRGSL